MEGGVAQEIFKSKIYPEREHAAGPVLAVSVEVAGSGEGSDIVEGTDHVSASSSPPTPTSTTSQTPLIAYDAQVQADDAHTKQGNKGKEKLRLSRLESVLVLVATTAVSAPNFASATAFDLYCL